MIKLGIIGYGYWGPNLVRNFVQLENAQVIAVCDLDADALRRVSRAYPHIQTTRQPDDILQSTDIDAVVVVTPVSTHFELGKKALENGKHLFVEKPFTLTSSEAEILIEIAERGGRTIMVDHTFLFTGSVRKIKELMTDEMLGKLYYYDSTRVNLGLFQHDVNVIWDLAPHDLSIMDYVIEPRPVAISATGSAHFNNGLEDVAYITIYFNDNMIAHFNVNWLSPVKIRSVHIGGEKRMLVWNDLEADEKVKIYDKGVKIDSKEGIYDLLVEYRSGDILIPKIDHTEALKHETDYFIDCIMNDRVPINDGAAGLRIVRMLEASDRSIKQKGALVNL